MPEFDQLLPLRTASTVVRRLHVGDLSIFHAYRSDPAVGRYQGWSTMDRDAARDFLQEMSRVDRLVPGGWIQLAIADADSGALLGDLGLYLDESQEEGEIGFTLAHEARRKGHATRAILAALDLMLRVSAAARHARSQTNVTSGRFERWNGQASSSRSGDR
jgi:[ribosomal protein S5]-alanine N-acetyltransferase